MNITSNLRRMAAILPLALSSSLGWAGPSGNAIAFPDKWRPAVSVHIDPMFTKDLDEVYDGNTHDMDSMAYYVQTSFSPLEDIALDARLGIADFSVQKTSEQQIVDAPMEFGADLFFGLGARGRVYKIPRIDTWVSVGAQYNHYAPGEPSYGNMVFDMEVDAWNISVDLSTNIPELGPMGEDWTVYGGLRYSGLRADYWHGPSTLHHGAFEAAIPVGIYMGTEYIFMDRIFGDFEFQLIDEYGISFGGGYKF